MKDEIKEIIEKPNIYMFNDECYLYFGDYNKLKDYITNLQDRIDKATEYIKQNICDIDYMKKEYGKYVINCDMQITIKDIENLLNILGGDPVE